MSSEHAQPTKTAAIYIQPGPIESLGEAPGSTLVDGVSVRYLKDTQEDAQFAGRLTVEAFREKIAHNVTEAKISIVIKTAVANYQGQDDSFYKRTFVAEHDGRQVGLLQIRCRGDRTVFRDDHLNELGYWHMCRFGCSAAALDEKIKDRRKCYLDHIAVDQSARGKGVGKLLMQRAEYEARLRGCTIIYLHVTTTNRARHLYERQGYRITETESCCGFLGCFIGPPGSAYLMEKML